MTFQDPTLSSHSPLRSLHNHHADIMDYMELNYTK